MSLRTRTAASALLLATTASAVLAQTPGAAPAASSPHAGQTAAAAKASASAPSDAAQDTRSYRSAFDGYRPYKEQAVGSWREANDLVGRIGGWQAYARESAGGPPADAASAPTGHNMPGIPAGHGGMTAQPPTGGTPAPMSPAQPKTPPTSAPAKASPAPAAPSAAPGGHSGHKQ